MKYNFFISLLIFSLATTRFLYNVVLDENQNLYNEVSFYQNYILLKYKAKQKIPKLVPINGICKGTTCNLRYNVLKVIQIANIGNYTSYRIIFENISSDLLTVSSSNKHVDRMTHLNELIMLKTLLVKILPTELDFGITLGVDKGIQIEIKPAIVLIKGNYNENKLLLNRKENKLCYLYNIMSGNRCLAIKNIERFQVVFRMGNFVKIKITFARSPLITFNKTSLQTGLINVLKYLIPTKKFNIIGLEKTIYEKIPITLSNHIKPLYGWVTFSEKGFGFYTDISMDDYFFNLCEWNPETLRFSYKCLIAYYDHTRIGKDHIHRISHFTKDGKVSVRIEFNFYPGEESSYSEEFVQFTISDEIYPILKRVQKVQFKPLTKTLN
jgi:hypothetical protein